MVNSCGNNRNLIFRPTEKICRQTAQLRLNEWPPFWGPFLDPKNGGRFVGKISVTGRKIARGSLFLHVRDRSFPRRCFSMVLQRRRHLFSTPCALRMPWRMCGAPRLKKRRDYNVKVAFRGFPLLCVFLEVPHSELKLCETQTGCRNLFFSWPERYRGGTAHCDGGPSGTEAVPHIVIEGSSGTEAVPRIERPRFKGKR